MPEMGQQQAAAKPGQLAGQNSNNSSSCVFKPISSPGKLEHLGLTPVPKVRVRPSSMKKRKPCALDKQLRHVALLQRRNRRAAAQQAQQQEQQQQRQQALAGFSKQLRADILAGDSKAVQRTWQPAAAAAAAAAALQEQQSAAVQHTRQQQSKLQGNAAVTEAARPGSRSLSGFCAEAGCRKGSSSSCAQPGRTREPNEAAATAAAAFTDADNAGDESSDDVHSFLDGLLQQAAAQKAGSSSSSKAAAPSPNQAASQTATSRPSTAASAAAGGLAGKQQQQKGKGRPAWALSQQQQAAAAAAAAAAAEEAAAADEAAEEREMLQFAEGLSWEQVVGQLDDEQLAAAFQELDAVERQAASGDPSADGQWRRCFVSALNQAVMAGVSAAAATAAGSAGAAGAAGSEVEHDRRSVVSSASQARRDEAIAARRQKLLDRLACIGGSGSSRAGSICSGGSRFGGEQEASRRAGGSGTSYSLNPEDAWEGSTRVGGDDVAVLTSALKALEAGEVLAENPEMRGVHSVASVRSMLQKVEGQK